MGEASGGGRAVRSALLITLGLVVIAAPIFTILLLIGVFDGSDDSVVSADTVTDQVPIPGVADNVPDASSPAASTSVVPSTTVTPATTVPPETAPPTTVPAETAPPTTQPVTPLRQAHRDFNGDGFSDVLWYAFSGGDTYIWYGNTGVVGFRTVRECVGACGR